MLSRYLKISNIDKPWRDEALLTLFDKAKLRISRRRAFLLMEAMENVRNIPGNFAELGVYKGSTSYIMADYILKSKQNRKLYLFDTFAGTPKESTKDNMHREKQYSDTSLEGVKEFLFEYSNITRFYPGFIPDSFSELKDERFAFLHIHLNLYESTENALRCMYPRMETGGIILIEDYGLKRCHGVKKAADTFFSDKRMPVLHIPTGQGFAIKLD